jgi:hypothetical protein
LRCTRCGNDNGEGNRFCGMCGAPMTPGAQVGSPSKQPQAATMAGPQAGRNPAPAVRPERSPLNPAPTPSLSPFDPKEPEAPISGPSFLGLNQPGQSQAAFKRSDSDGSRDLLRPSGSVDYLLDEEDEPKRGWGKVIFVLVALALAGGFGYLHWKQGGFNWVYGSGAKPAATQPDSGGASNSSDNGATGTAAPSSPSANPAPNPPTTAPTASGTPASGTNPAANGSPSVGSAPAGTAAGAAPAPAGAAPATGTAITQPAAPQTAPTTSQATSPDNSPQNNPANAQSSSPQPSAPAATASIGSDSATQPSVDEEPPAPAAKPAPKPAPPKPADTVAEAERYVYGRGAHQDCDRGLLMLKSAADRSDTKAMISLGGLYSAGTCTPRDLPTAYRWFALALHKQPDNQALQDDLQKLWSQMTQAERQLAIRLSQ